MTSSPEPADAREALRTECRALCRYLLDAEPEPGVVDAYGRAHALDPERLRTPRGPVDRALLDLARRGGVRARAADGYAAVFARHSLLRRKLALLTAILESHGPTAAALDTADAGGPVGFLWRALGLGLAAALRLPLALALLALALVAERRR